MHAAVGAGAPPAAPLRPHKDWEEILVQMCSPRVCLGSSDKLQGRAVTPLLSSSREALTSGQGCVWGKAVSRSSQGSLRPGPEALHVPSGAEGQWWRGQGHGQTSALRGPSLSPPPGCPAGLHAGTGSRLHPSAAGGVRAAPTGAREPLTCPAWTLSVSSPMRPHVSPKPGPATGSFFPPGPLENVRVSGFPHELDSAVPPEVS